MWTGLALPALERACVTQQAAGTRGYAFSYAAVRQPDGADGGTERPATRSQRPEPCGPWCVREGRMREREFTLSLQPKKIAPARVTPQTSEPLHWILYAPVRSGGL